MLFVDIAKSIKGVDGTVTLRVKAEVKSGTFVVVMGESGSGKTTLLRCIAGLEQCSGTIAVGEEIWQNEHKVLSPKERNVGFVFQDYALFDNMSVKENLLYVNRDEALAVLLLKMLEIVALSDRNVRTLSGGQKQRVALARALMRRPKLLLMDEPFSALDPRMRRKAAKEIVALHKRFGTTTLMVSHDIEEAKTMADEVWFVEKGAIVCHSPTYLDRLYDEER